MFTPSGIFTLETEQNKIRVNESPRACGIAAALSATDEEIDASIRRPHSICSRRNAFAPICALPPELLSQVFHFCALEELSCYSVQRLGHGHTRISALASSRARRLVAVGQDHGILAQRWVGLPGVVSRAECVALHQHYEHVGRRYSPSSIRRSPISASSGPAVLSATKGACEIHCVAGK